MDLDECREKPILEQVLGVSLTLVLLMAVIGVAYVTFEMPIPQLLAGVIAIFFAGIAVARFYYVVKYQ